MMQENQVDSMKRQYEPQSNNTYYPDHTASTEAPY